MIDGQRVFHANMCFICRQTIKEVKLKHCSSCKLVLYCSKSHQKKHWRAHRDFCRVSQEVEKKLPVVNFDSNENWYQYRTNLMILCELHLGRKLQHHEMNMVLFPNNCQICHKRTNLTPCWNCLCVNYCSDDHKDADFGHHSSTCHLLLLSREIDMYQENEFSYSVLIVRQGDIELLDDITFFMASNVTVTKRHPVAKNIEDALISELLTCPLTLLYALNKLNYSLGQYSILHIVGSSMLETAFLKSWEIILKIHNNIKNLKIYFIGPDVREVDMDSYYDERLSFHFSKQCYHDFVNSESYEKPNLICVFNCGFHEFEGVQNNTWKSSLPLLVEDKSLPFIFTSFTKDEAEQDLRLLQEVEPTLKHSITLNPFCSLRPFRDPVTLGIFFNNNHLGIVTHDRDIVSD